MKKKYFSFGQKVEVVDDSNWNGFKGLVIAVEKEKDNYYYKLVGIEGGMPAHVFSHDVLQKARIRTVVRKRG